MKHTALLFDFDGTLVDSMPYWSDVMLQILKISGVSYPSDIIKTVTPLGDVGSAHYYRDVLGVAMSVEDMLALKHQLLLPKYRDEIPLKEGVLAYLKQQKAQGASLNVLTASPHQRLDICLQHNGIYDLFDHVWSCDDFQTTKSDPRIYTEAVKRIGVPVERAVFFDDNVNAIQTARQAGLFTVGVYDPSGEEFKAQLAEIADVYINSFLSVPAL